MRTALHLSIPVLLVAILASTAPPAGAAELGTWWRDSDVVRGLKLRESQIRQIEQAFLTRRTELNQLAADLQLQENRLQTLIDTSSLNEKQAAAQIDQVVNARARLEKAKTLMAFDIRRAVSYEQWKKLQELQRDQSDDPSPSAAAAGKHTPKAEAGAPAAEEPVYLIGGPVSDPVALQRPMPAFTSEARTRRITGNILLSIVIGKDGAVRDVRVLRGLGYGLDESAVETVKKKWAFRPSLLNGQPVSVQANIEITFR